MDPLSYESLRWAISNIEDYITDPSVNPECFNDANRILSKLEVTDPNVKREITYLVKLINREQKGSPDKPTADEKDRKQAIEECWQKIQKEMGLGKPLKSESVESTQMKKNENLKALREREKKERVRDAIFGKFLLLDSVIKRAKDQNVVIVDQQYTTDLLTGILKDLTAIIEIYEENPNKNPSTFVYLDDDWKPNIGKLIEDLKKLDTDAYSKELLEYWPLNSSNLLGLLKSLEL